MRLHIRTTANGKPVPFNYQRSLVGAFHKWLGKNDQHDDISLYSLSWLYGGKRRGPALNFPAGAVWQISTPDGEMLKKVISGIQDDPKIDFGMEVREMLIQHDPVFSKNVRFLVGSPVLVKRNEENKRIRYYLHHEVAADDLLTDTLKHKLEKAGKAQLEVSVSFDRDYTQAHTKMINYNGIYIKGSVCPVLIKGDPEALSFAWNVGVGNSTGIGFGSLR